MSLLDIVMFAFGGISAAVAIGWIGYKVTRGK